jgi:hypothetical protein
MKFHKNLLKIKRTEELLTNDNDKTKTKKESESLFNKLLNYNKDKTHEEESVKKGFLNIVKARMNKTLEVMENKVIRTLNMKHFTELDSLRKTNVKPKAKKIKLTKKAPDLNNIVQLNTENIESLNKDLNNIIKLEKVKKKQLYMLFNNK